MDAIEVRTFQLREGKACPATAEVHVSADGHVVFWSAATRDGQCRINSKRSEVGVGDDLSQDFFDKVCFELTKAMNGAAA